ncbi:MAG TPA: protein kinase, partial [Archangium sp.]
MRIARDDVPDEPLGLDLLAGAEVAGFIIERRLASGSFGALYQARRGGKRFAIKLVPWDARGEREVDALRRVRELPVVGFHGYGLWPEEKPRFIVLALELVEGVALDTWAREFNPSTSELLTQVMLPLVSTLGQLHAAGVVHRDVKEANIVMRQKDGHPVLVDFGAAGFE